MVGGERLAPGRQGRREPGRRDRRAVVGRRDRPRRAGHRGRPERPRPGDAAPARRTRTASSSPHEVELAGIGRARGGRPGPRGPTADPSRRRRGRRRRRPRSRRRSSRVRRPTSPGGREDGPEQRRRVALEPAAPDRDRRLAGEDAGQLDDPAGRTRRRRACRAPRGRRRSPRRRRAAPRSATAGRSRSARRWSGRTARPRHVRRGRWAGRSRRRSRRRPARRRCQPDDALALLAGRDLEHEPARRRVVERDRRGLGGEQGGRRLDDRAQDGRPRRSG